MARHTGRHGVKRSWAGGVAVFMLVALSGYLLITNVRVNRTSTVSSDTADLIEQRVARVSELQEDITRLSSQIRTLNELSSDGHAESDAESGASSTILPALEGPGISVTLDDSPLWEKMVDSSGSAANINDYVIHQEDIESVMNALWAGGAEAMMIQDQRVLFNSAVICQGNVLLLQGRKYSPPYTVSAIGPVDGMLKALDESKAITIYQEYVSAFGVGWQVETKDNLQFPEAAALLQSLQYSHAIDEGTDDSDADGGTEASGTDDTTDMTNTTDTTDTKAMDNQ